MQRLVRWESGGDAEKGKGREEEFGCEIKKPAVSGNEILNGNGGV